MMITLNTCVAVADASFFLGMIAFTYCFGHIYDWWYAKKRQQTPQTPLPHA